MSDDLVTLWRYRDLPEALIAHAKLDSEGFDCVLVDDNFVRLNWFWSNVIGGVRLMVRDDDIESALAVLGEEIPAEFTADDVGEDYQQPACPNCASRDVDFETSYRGVALAALWLWSVPLPIPKKRWHCEDCGHEWKGEYL